MQSIEEKRIYGDRQGAITAYVASAMGVVRVRVAGDTVGEFGLCERCGARDVAASPDAIAVATDDDVRVLELEAESTSDREGDTPVVADDESFVETGFGPAVAVGFDGDDVLAAGPDGRVARRTAGADEWTTLSDSLETAVRAIDGDLVGTADGVYRVSDDGLEHAGLSDVRDVSAAGVPLAATADGLYKLGNGWMTVLEGPFETVAADPRSERGELVRAHAVATDGVYEFVADEWHAIDGSSEQIVGVGYGETTYAVTDEGTFLAWSDGEWRTRALGVRDVSGLAVRPERQ
ncbi:MAG: HVO_0234 family beta-propeller protein [Natrinema limicola]